MCPSRGADALASSPSPSDEYCLGGADSGRGGRNCSGAVRAERRGCGPAAAVAPSPPLPAGTGWAAAIVGVLFDLGPRRRSMSLRVGALILCIPKCADASAVDWAFCSIWMSCFCCLRMRSEDSREILSESWSYIAVGMSTAYREGQERFSLRSSNDPVNLTYKEATNHTCKR